MDKHDYITNPSERKKGKCLTAEDRGAIQSLRKEDYGVRAIARNIGCAPGTITPDKGSEFADFAQVEDWGTKVYYAHPYSSWKRPQNERNNGLFRTYVPKAESIEQYSEKYVLIAADELNSKPRKKLG